MTLDPLHAKRIFEDAIDRPTEQREAFLTKACGSDADLRQYVDSLLGALDEADEFLQGPAPTPDVAPDSDHDPNGSAEEREGAISDRYQLVECIGEGGFGTVWIAEQQHPIRRTVALKVIKLGMDTKQVIARFEAERQALALMDHPNIAKVLDGGTTRSGRPFFVMELVKGVPITQYCDEARLSTTQRLEIFQQVCNAVQHAHQKGIIHRDLKPSNILVTTHDGRPVPVVIDFGIAKATSAEVTKQTVFTESHQWIGTLEYMSPEQTDAGSLDVDTRADIYGLGVILYELLTGTVPFERRELLKHGYLDMIRVIREEEPAKPSTRIRTNERALALLARRRQSTPKALRRTIRGDLDWIVMKAIEKDRNRRYATANDLAADLGHYLLDEPVIACPPSRIYRMRKYFRRHRVSAIAGMTVFLALVAGLGMASWGLVEARNQRDAARAAQRLASQEKLHANEEREKALAEESRARAEEAKAKAEALRAKTVVDFLQGLLRYANPLESGRRDIKMSEALAEFDTYIGDKGLGPQLEGQPEVEAELRTILGETYGRIGKFAQSEEQLRLARAKYRSIYGEGSLQDARAESRVGATLWLQGRYGEAEKLIRKGLSVLQARSKTEDHGILEALTNLGATMQAQSKFADAENYIRQAIRISRRLKDSESMALNLANLATVFGNLHRIEDARDLLMEALDLDRKELGPRHPRVAMDLMNLALIDLRVPGEESEAENHAGQALEMFRGFFKETHPRVLEAQSVLAVALLNRGKVKEAENLALKGLTKARTCLDKGHRVTMNLLKTLGGCAGRTGRTEQAGKYLEEALAIGLRRNEYASIEVLDCLVKLVNYCLYPQRKYAEAERRLRKALKAVGERYSPDHPLILDMRASLANCVFDQNRFAESERLYNEILPLLRKAPKPDYYDIATLLRNLAMNYHLLGKNDKAVETFRDAIKTFQLLFPPTDVHVTGSIANLGRVYLAQKDYKRAEETLKTVLPDLIAGYSPGHTLVVASQRYYARALRGQGKYVEAIPVLKRVVETLRKAPRYTDTTKIAVFSLLGQTLLKVGRFDEAEAICTECLGLHRWTKPSKWAFYRISSLLGESLAGQKKFKTAESRLLEAYEKMDPPASYMWCKSEALASVVFLYERWKEEDPDKIEAYRKWKKKLDDLKAKTAGGKAETTDGQPKKEKKSP